MPGSRPAPHFQASLIVSETSVISSEVGETVNSSPFERATGIGNCTDELLSGHTIIPVSVFLILALTVTRF